MRLPLALLSFSLLPFIFSLQVPLAVNTTSITIVDVLSQDPDYESLIHLLQRTKLIPTLNKLKGATFFAPTNEALRKADLDLSDNVQHALRQRLFYHLLNYTLPPDDDTDTELEVLQTLYFPDVPLEPPTREPPPLPPWLPVPGGTLGGKSQRLRMSKRDRIAVDAFGKGGINIVKDKVEAANGIVLGIDKIIETPPNLAEVVSTRPELSYFTRILTPLPSVINFLNSTPALTLFLPVDSAWDALHSLERLYLESEFAADDLQHILQRHAVLDSKTDSLQSSDRVVYSDLLKEGINRMLTLIHPLRLPISLIYHSNHSLDSYSFC
jgi:solute carrier family 25 carnitine/acylcarnitine transporter 20/29